MAYVLKRGTAPVAIGAVLFAITTAGWFVLRSLSTGAGGLEITLNWKAIVALGVPLVALTLLLVGLFLSVALWQADHDTTFVEFERLKKTRKARRPHAGFQHVSEGHLKPETSRALEPRTGSFCGRTEVCPKGPPALDDHAPQ
jgi:hypothetical protein